jgi:dipeptidase E
MRRVLLLSTSTVHGGGYLEYAVPYLRQFLGDVGSVLFVPYARPSGISHDRYASLFHEPMTRAGFDVTSVHTSDDPVAAVESAESVFIGGGNTFVLLDALHRKGLVEPIRSRVAAGMPYMGSSAGSNVAGLTLGTTNDMPIVQPPSFEALALLPFNINPHFIDADPDSTHMGETRETRINEFHCFNDQPVVAMREGAMLRVDGDTARLDGTRGGLLFRAGEDPSPIETGDSLDYLL